MNASPYYLFSCPSFLVWPFPICVGVLVSSGLLLRGVFCFPSLCTPFSLPSRSMVVSIWPNETSHVALPSHAYYYPIRSISCRETGPASTAFSSPFRTAVAVTSGIPREWSQLVSHEAVGPSPILCGRMALSLHHRWGLGSSLFLGVESPSLIVLIWN